MSLDKIQSLPHFLSQLSSEDKNISQLMSIDAFNLIITAPIGTYYFRQAIKEEGLIVAFVQIGDKHKTYSCLQKFVFSLAQVEQYGLTDLEKHMAEKILADKQAMLDSYTKEAKKYPAVQRIKTTLTEQIEHFKMQPITDWIKSSNFHLNCIVIEELKEKVTSFLEMPIKSQKEEMKVSVKNLANSMNKGLYRSSEEEPSDLAPSL